MAVIAMYRASLRACNTFVATTVGLQRVGLFQNDIDPKEWFTISAIVPCNFSGYDGLHDMLTWNTAVMVGNQAVAKQPERFWVHDGGAVQGYVYGYYVVDDEGELLWAERDPNGPVPMFYAGNLYRCVPTWSQQSKFSGE